MSDGRMMDIDGMGPAIIDQLTGKRYDKGLHRYLWQLTHDRAGRIWSGWGINPPTISWNLWKTVNSLPLSRLIYAYGYPLCRGKSRKVLAANFSDLWAIAGAKKKN